MTMILTMLGEETGLFSLGDILLSGPAPGRADLPLPLQFRSVARTSAGHSPRGFSQKITIVSPSAFVSWAGSYAIARTLIRAIRDAGKPEEAVDLTAVVAASGLLPNELDQVSLIVHQLIGRRMQVDCLNATHGHIEGVEAAWQGSGAFDFLQDTIIDAGGRAATFQTIMRGLMLRLASTLAGEALHGSPYDYLYGGWFEIVISRTLGLRKIPYAIKFWGRRDGELGYDAPLFFNWYKGKSLFICSLDQHAGSSDVRVIEVPDLLSDKRWRTVRCKPICRPEFTFHVVMDDRDGHTEIHVSDRHSDGHISVHVTKGGAYTMTVKRAFIDRMMVGNATPDFKLKKASDAGD